MSSTVESHYAVLGVSAEASHDEIKRAYRKLSLKYHPDRNNGSAETELYKRINEAYETVGDPVKREAYDQTQPLYKKEINHDIPVHDILGSLFASLPPKMRSIIPEHIHLRGGFHPQEGMFFGLHPQHNNNIAGNTGSIYDKPAHIVKQLHITFEQSCSGCSLPLEVERTIMTEHRQMRERETVYVKVHQGVDDGEIIVIKGRGNATAWTQSDIRVVVMVSGESVFRRRGLDLLFVKAISLREALCGVSFEIHHPNKRALKISTRGKVVGPTFEKRVNGFGITRVDPTDGATETGDLVLTFAIEFPTTLEPATVDAIEQLLP